jgi:uncharacterized protein
VARGERTAPDWAAPDLKVIQELGLRHEKAYLAHLASQGLVVENLGHIDHKEEARLLAETLALMERGAQVIAQGALSDGEWFGRPDVLRRVATPSKRWKWSYEVEDTKLARETKATTILQLSLYSDLLAKIQGTVPEFLRVVPPGEGFAGEKYRVSEYAAYSRFVMKRLRGAVGEGASKETYPEPVEHCNVCRWFRECDVRRRADDHLSLVAGIRRQQRDQFEVWNAETMAKLAVLAIPLKERPKHGSKAGLERVREQGRVQVEGRTEKKLKHELLLPVTEGMGFCRLPEPSVGDMFVDLEGDPFVGENGLQYLFGFAVLGVAGELKYEKRWALNREEEKKGFEWLVDEIMRRREANPKIHVYHFGAYEPGALKRLMGMYATREDEIDRLLRAGVMVAPVVPGLTDHEMPAILKAAAICTGEPERATRVLVERKLTDKYDYALQMMKELSFSRWRDYDLTASLRFYALRLHEAVQPFIAFAKSGSFKLFGDGFVLTNGSQSRRQLTAGDFRALLAAAGEKEA